jgi:hypothetical protein
MSARPFFDFLREHRGGATHDDLSDALQELVAAVAEGQKAGRLTLTISIKPADSGNGALFIADEIKLFPPKVSKSGSIFYVSPENNLVRHDPKQMPLPLQDIRGDAAQPREIGVPASAARALA